MRWPDVRSERTYRDVRPERPCGSARSHRVPCDEATPDALRTLPEAVARDADDVCHLDSGTAHSLTSLRERFTVSGLVIVMASIGVATACKCRRERCR